MNILGVQLPKPIQEKKLGLLMLATLLSCVETRPSKQKDGVSTNKYGTFRLCHNEAIKFRDAWVGDLNEKVEEKKSFKKCVRKNQGRLATDVMKQLEKGADVVFVEDTHISGVDNFSDDGASQDDFILDLYKYEELIPLALDAGIVVYREYWIDHT